MPAFHPSSATRSWLQARLEQYSDMLASFTLTPLLQEQLRHASAAFRIALQDGANIPSSELVSLHTQIHAHWTSLFGTPTRTNLTLNRIHLIREFLTRLLCEEYVSYLPSSFPGMKSTRGILKSTKTLEEFRMREYWIDMGKRMKAAEYLPEFDNSILELFLDISQSRTKVELYTSSNGKSHSQVDFFIGECDWKGLASMLKSDKEVISKLGAFHARGHETLNQMLEGVERARDEVERLFFEGLGVTAKAKACEAERETRRRREVERERARVESQRSRNGAKGFFRLEF
ncbi:MAG: hypothetical protein M1812_003410 [Candelaria pacifica]|nr:MAG: hypothetical protein M1812_003410 [Candelaria pacifica]